MPKFVSAKTGGLVLYAIGKDSEPDQVQIDHMLKNGALGPVLDAVRQQVGFSMHTRSLANLWEKACDAGVFPESERGQPTVHKLPPALLAAEATELRENTTMEVGAKFQVFPIYAKEQDGPFLMGFEIIG